MCVLDYYTLKMPLLRNCNESLTVPSFLLEATLLRHEELPASYNSFCDINFLPFHWKTDTIKATIFKILYL